MITKMAICNDNTAKSFKLYFCVNGLSFNKTHKDRAELEKLEREILHDFSWAKLASVFPRRFAYAEKMGLTKHEPKLTRPDASLASFKYKVARGHKPQPPFAANGSDLFNMTDAEREDLENPLRGTIAPQTIVAPKAFNFTLDFDLENGGKLVLPVPQDVLATAVAQIIWDYNNLSATKLNFTKATIKELDNGRAQ